MELVILDGTKALDQKDTLRVGIIGVKLEEQASGFAPGFRGRRLHKGQEFLPGPRTARQPCGDELHGIT